MYFIFGLFPVFLVASISRASPLSDEIIRYHSKEAALFRQAVAPPYDKDVRPPGLENIDDPITLSCSLYFLDLKYCRESKILRVSGYFRHRWTDLRLKVTDDPAAQNMTIRQFPDMFKNGQIWIPDTFIVNSRDGFVQGGPGSSFLRVKGDGSILSSFKLNTQVECDELLPGDVTCSLEFESYGYSASDVKYIWSSPDNEPVSVGYDANKNRGIKITETKAKGTSSVLSSGTYDRIYVSLNLKIN